MSRTLPLIFIYWLVPAFFMKKLYLWAQYSNPMEAFHQHLITYGQAHAIAYKHPMLSIPSVWIQSAICFAIWMTFMLLLNKWGLQRDADMARVVAEHGAPVIIMHNRETADAHIDIIADVDEFFSRSLEIAWTAGIARDRIVLDPGIGFGKTPEQSMACIAKLEKFHSFGLPLLVGASRKRFIASVTPSEPTERLGGSLAAHLIASENGAAIIRTHDVAPTLQALAVAAAIRRAR